MAQSPQSTESDNVWEVTKRKLIKIYEILGSPNKARSTDSVITLGGEEFLIIVPDSKPKDAIKFAKWIRISLVQHDVSEVCHTTASFGAAGLRFGESIVGLLNRADKALYKAKVNGKNWVTLVK